MECLKGRSAWWRPRVRRVVNGESRSSFPSKPAGAVLAPLAKGIGEIDGDFLKVRRATRPDVGSRVGSARGSGGSNRQNLGSISFALVRVVDPAGSHAFRLRPAASP